MRRVAQLIYHTASLRSAGSSAAAAREPFVGSKPPRPTMSAGPILAAAGTRGKAPQRRLAAAPLRRRSPGLGAVRPPVARPASPGGRGPGDGLRQGEQDPRGTAHQGDLRGVTGAPPGGRRPGDAGVPLAEGRGSARPFPGRPDRAERGAARGDRGGRLAALAAARAREPRAGPGVSDPPGAGDAGACLGRHYRRLPPCPADGFLVSLSGCLARSEAAHAAIRDGFQIFSVAFAHRIRLKPVMIPLAPWRGARDPAPVAEAPARPLAGAA